MEAWGAEILGFSVIFFFMRFTHHNQEKKMHYIMFCWKANSFDNQNWLECEGCQEMNKLFQLREDTLISDLWEQNSNEVWVKLKTKQNAGYKSDLIKVANAVKVKLLMYPTENKLTLFWKKGVNEYLIAASPLKKGCKRVWI